MQLTEAKLIRDGRCFFMQWIDYQWDRLPAKACSQMLKGASGRDNTILEDSWKPAEKSICLKSICLSCLVFPRNLPMTTTGNKTLPGQARGLCLYKQGQLQVMLLTSDALLQSNVSRTQQLTGFRTEHLEHLKNLKNSKRRLWENSIATSIASLLPILMGFIFTSIIYHLLIFFPSPDNSKYTSDVLLRKIPPRQTTQRYHLILQFSLAVGSKQPNSLTDKCFFL